MKIIWVTLVLVFVSTYLFALPYFLILLKDGFKDFIYYTKKAITENEELTDAIKDVFLEIVLYFTGFWFLVLIFLMPFINIILLKNWSGGIKNPFYKGK